MNSLNTHSYGNNWLDLSLKPTAIAARYQRELVISFKTHVYYSTCWDNLLKPTTIAAASKKSVKTLNNNINLSARVQCFLQNPYKWQHRHSNTQKNNEIQQLPNRFLVKAHEFLQQAHQRKIQHRTEPPEMLPAEAPALRKHVSPSRPHAASPRPLARTARTTRTRNETDFPVVDSSPQPPIFPPKTSVTRRGSYLFCIELPRSARIFGSRTRQI